ncbi:unnamed protein product, partial [Rotaria magnacalcarata]
MPRKSKRQAHSRTVTYGFLRKQILDSDRCSGSFEGGFDVGANDSSQERLIGFQDNITSDDLSALFELCKSQCPVKHLSVLLCMTLRRFGSEVFICGDLDEFALENRGGKYSAEFDDFFPELKDAAKQHVLERCSEKSASFTLDNLTKFIDKKFYETTNTIKEPDIPLIQSLSACKVDLCRWGARFKKNSQRPYFEGHERAEVVEHREQYINYFLDRKDHYYTITDDDKPAWKYPSRTPPCILI